MPHSPELYGRIPAQPHGGPARCTPTQQRPAACAPEVADAAADAVTDVGADAGAMAPVGS